MILYKRGDLLCEPAEALVNTVNCVGASGRGIALQFEKKFPDNHKAYLRACGSGALQLGTVHVFQRERLENPRYIINFPTKNHWREKSTLESIASGLSALEEAIIKYRIASVAIPPLGCGLGGLDWTLVREMISERLSSLAECQVIVFEPSNDYLLERTVEYGRGARMTSATASLILLIEHYLSSHLDPWVTLLEIQKLLYFLQQVGEPLRLDFVAAPHGPYAANLRHVMKRNEGVFTSGYGEGGDAPYKEISLIPGANEAAQEFIRGHKEVSANIAKVIKLVEGFEDSYGMELLASVHWVAANNEGLSLEGIIESLHRWSKSKERFTIEQVAIAYRRLAANGLLPELT